MSVMDLMWLFLGVSIGSFIGIIITAIFSSNGDDDYYVWKTAKEEVCAGAENEKTEGRWFLLSCIDYFSRLMLLHGW